MVFIKKRELVIYCILRRKFSVGRKINLGDIYSFLSPFISRKTLRNIVKRLMKYKLIEKVNNYDFVLKPLDTYLNKLIIGFYCSKLGKFLRKYEGRIVCYENEIIIITKNADVLSLLEEHMNFLRSLGISVKVRLPLQKSQQQS